MALKCSNGCEITPILCIGETKTERQDGETKQVLHDQLMTAFSNITSREVRNTVIAYEPVWAIGQVAAKPDQIAEAVSYIRNYVSDVYSKKAGEDIRILYGGDVMPEVVHGILNIPGIDGLLVGHASINYSDFSEIVSAARRWQRGHEEASEQ